MQVWGGKCPRDCGLGLGAYGAVFRPLALLPTHVGKGGAGRPRSTASRRPALLAIHHGPGLSGAAMPHAFVPGKVPLAQKGLSTVGPNCDGG